MPLHLAIAQRADASRIAEIHMAAFGTNAMLRAQFPTAGLREGVRGAVEIKALADIEDAKTTVLVVRDVPESDDDGPKNEEDGDGLLEDAGGPVVAFAKWSHPVPEGGDEEYVEPPWVWPEGTNWDVLEGWARKSEEAQERALGRTPCYRLTFIATDPAHEGRGAASLLVRWGMRQCEIDGVPAYLESTLEAVDFYKKRGFTPLETFSLDVSHVGCGIYSETSFVYRPGRK